MRQKIVPFLLLLIYSQYVFINLLFPFLGVVLWLKYSTTITYYLCVAVVVWLERNQLSEYHLDSLSVLVILLSGSIFRTRLGIPGEIYYLVVIWVLSIVILFGFAFNRTKIPKTNIRWLLIGIAIAFLSMIPITILESFQPYKWLDSNLNADNLVLFTIRDAIYILSFVSPMEEVIFRGLIWGCLRRFGWTENRIFWTQAVLFWIIHFTRIASPITFFISIPIVTITCSLLARYSKQVFPSIVAHTLINITIPILVMLYLD